MMIDDQMDGVPMSDGQERELCSDRWSAQLLDRISRQRSDGRHLCDVIVECDVSDDDVFPAHRCVLAASSDYFATLFTSALQGGDVIRDGSCHVTINTSLLDVSRDVVDTVWTVHSTPIVGSYE